MARLRLLALSVLLVPQLAQAAPVLTVTTVPSFQTAGVLVAIAEPSADEAVLVEVKGPADADFRRAHACVAFEPHACATSLFGLQPDTDYAVRVSGAGAASQTLTLHTRAEAPLPAPLRVRWVGPSGQDSDAAGGARETPYATPGYALAHALPGDEIRFLAGTYATVDVEGLHGTDAAPVVLRADDPNQKPIIDGGATGHALSVDDSSYLVVDGFEIRNGGSDEAGQGVYLRASARITVRGCSIHDNGHDDVLVAKSAEFSGGALLGGYHLIEDNDIADLDQDPCEGGSNTACPRQTYYGIKQDNNPGAGTVIRRNRIRGHDDNLSPCGDEDVGRSLADGQPVLAVVGSGPWTNHDLEIYDNVIEDARDDGIELDGICVNARVHRNHVHSAQNTISAAPALPGPYFFVRNVVSGTVGEAFFKLNTSGQSDVSTRHVFVYQNTFVRETAGTLLNLWFALDGEHDVPIHDLVFRNNVLSTPLGGACVNANNHGSEQPSFDGDFWFTTDQTHQFAWWNGVGTDHYDTFAAWQGGAAVEPNGGFGDPGLDATFHPLASSPVVDRAVPLPGINDTFAGTGPDVGAFEYGVPDPSSSSSGGAPGSSSGAFGGASSGGTGGTGGDSLDEDPGFDGDGDGGCGCKMHPARTGSATGLLALALLGRRGLSARRRAALRRPTPPAAL